MVAPGAPSGCCDVGICHGVGRGCADSRGIARRSRGLPRKLAAGVRGLRLGMRFCEDTAFQIHSSDDARFSHAAMTREAGPHAARSRAKGLWLGSDGQQAEREWRVSKVEAQSSAGPTPRSRVAPGRCAAAKRQTGRRLLPRAGMRETQ